jgi:hypothetical protein
MKAVAPTNQPLASGVSTTNELRDIKPPVEIPSGWEWVWWALGIAAALALAYLLWRYLRKSRAPVPLPPVPPHIRARQKLQEALALLNRPMEFVVAVSDAIRHYLEERFDFRAPERTTEEFMRELQQTDLLSASQKESLASFLQRCDLVKFAKYEPSQAELLHLHEAALRLVTETEPSEPIVETSAPQAATTGQTPAPT